MKNSFLFILSFNLSFLGTGAVQLVPSWVSKVIHEWDPLSGGECFASSKREMGIRVGPSVLQPCSRLWVVLVPLRGHPLQEAFTDSGAGWVERSPLQPVPPPSLPFHGAFYYCAALGPSLDGELLQHRRSLLLSVPSGAATLAESVLSNRSLAGCATAG